MSDLICRQAAIDALCRVHEYNGRSVEAIKQLPSVQLDTYWKEQCQSYEQTINKLRESLSTQPEIKQQAINSSDCIDRRAALDALRKMQTYKLFSGDDMLLIDQAGAQTELMLLPSAQPKKWRWISADAMFHGVPFYCSECGENTWDTVMGKPRWKFCPMCGAKMEGVDDE